MQTALGHLYEIVQGSEILHVTGGATATDMALRDYALKITDNVAHYVVAPAIVDLVQKKEVLRSISTLVHSGIHNLPFDPILIEYVHPQMGYRVFCRLQTAKLFPLNAKIREWSPPPGSVYCYPLQMLKNDARDSEFLSCIDPSGPVFIDFTEQFKGDDRGFVTVVQLSDGDDADGDRLRSQLGADCVVAMAIAMLMLNTKGVEKERVETAALNRARAKKGKRAIAEYTTIRVGTLYDRQGRAYHADGSGRHMPVHWRAGHVRNVRCGPRWSETRPVYIPPCLVNFEPEDGTVPQPPKHQLTV